MAEQYVNIRVILDKIHRHPLLSDLTFETVVDYAVDFMRIVGVPRIFIQKIAQIEISNYRGKLPCDYYETIQIRDTVTHEAFRYATDTFHLSNDKIASSDPTFMIQGDLIYTSIQEGTIEINYQAIQTDHDGFPMIPENSNLYRALEAYIKKQYFTILFDLGKIHIQSLQQAQQDYAWAVGACETEFHRLDLSKAESFFNSFRTLIIRDTEFQHGFRESGTKELLTRR